MIFWKLVYLTAISAIVWVTSVALRSIFLSDSSIHTQYGFEVKQELSSKRKYTFFSPSSRARKAPLIIFLNGRGQNGDDGIPLSKNFGPAVWEISRGFPFAVYAPQCSTHGAWISNSSDTLDALRELKRLIESDIIDKDRIVLTGVSAGGTGAWLLGSHYPQFFAACVPLCGSADWQCSLKECEAVHLWSVINAGDKHDLVASNSETERKIVFEGYSPFATVYSNSGHDCWSQAYRNKAIFEWMLQQSRTKNKLESEKFRLLDKEASLQYEALSLDVEGLLIKSTSSFKPIVCGNLPPVIDYHFHTKFVSGQTLALRLQSTNSDDQLVLHLPYAVDGPATFTKNSRNVFAYISPRAQNQLDPKGWNDIRLRVEKDRVSVMINGFHALEQQLDLSEIHGWNVSLEPSGPADTEMRFRYLRWRPLTWLMSSTN